MASSLGAGLYSDIFFIAFKLPNLFRRIFAEGAFTQTFIPAFARSRNKALFSTYIFTLFFGVVVLLGILVTLFSEPATRLIAIGFSEKTIQIAAPYVAINFWYLPLIFSVTFLAALLQYRHHFATTAFATSLLNLALIAALWLSKGLQESQIVLYLSYAVLIGGTLQLLLHVVMIKKLGLCKLLTGGFFHFFHKKHLIQSEIKKFKKEFFPAIWGNSTPQLSAFLDTWLASFLTLGTISYLYYANRVFQLPLALFAIATSVALFPKVSRFLKNAKIEEALFMMKRAFWLLAFVLGASTLVGVLLSEEIVTLLFQRGAFDAFDARNTADVLRMYLLGLLPFGLGKLFSLWIYASQNQIKAAKIASLALGSNILFSLLLIFPYGASGLALASSIGGFVSFWLTLKHFGLKHFLSFLHPRILALWLLSMTILAIITLIFKHFIHDYIY